MDELKIGHKWEGSLILNEVLGTMALYQKCVNELGDWENEPCISDWNALSS